MIFLLSCTDVQREQQPEHSLAYDSLYASYRLTGCFVLKHEGDTVPYVYNPSMAHTAFSPASTFKIPNALIALEEGIVRDTSQRIPWDGIVRNIPAWNQEHSLNTAFRMSVVWYFQEIARRIGPQKMHNWIDSLQYGNQDISGGIDRFWLDGGLRITPCQQVDFIQRLFLEELPCSVKSQELVKGLMEQERTPEYVFGGKTGWSKGDSLMTGWFVGYLQTPYDTIYFANCIQTKDSTNQEFGACRKEITKLILRDQGLMPQE